jgi:N-acetylglucosamine-6-sulfatase
MLSSVSQVPHSVDTFPKPLVGARSRRLGWRSAVVGLVAVVLPMGVMSRGLLALGDSPDQLEPPPNIILITTDDQRTNDMNWMPKTRAALGEQGYTFPQGLSPHPLCCPARAEYLTGQYGQNNGVRHNQGKFGGYQALLEPDNTVASWLDDAGYQTAIVGKYLNGVGLTTERPAGWDHWNAYVAGTGTYNNTTFANDGDPVLHTEHADDVTTDYAVDYMAEFAESDDPMFMWVSYFAPHTANTTKGWDRNLARPAPEYIGSMSEVKLPVVNKPSFNEGNVSDQLPPSRGAKPVSVEQAEKLFQSRIESLQTVDDGVAELVAQLDELGELDNTYIFFTSDNGFLLGEHRLFLKNELYRESLEVPWLVRVPGVSVARESEVPITATDLAPTIVELAGATPERVMDGQSFAPLLSSLPVDWRDTQLIQTGRPKVSLGQWNTRGVRTDRYMYGRSVQTGKEMLFDHTWDEYETQNIATWAAYRPILEELRRRTEILSDCVGVECYQDFGVVPDPL